METILLRALLLMLDRYPLEEVIEDFGAAIKKGDSREFKKEAENALMLILRDSEDYPSVQKAVGCFFLRNIKVLERSTRSNLAKHRQELSCP